MLTTSMHCGPVVLWCRSCLPLHTTRRISCRRSACCFPAVTFMLDPSLCQSLCTTTQIFSPFTLRAQEQQVPALLHDSACILLCPSSL